MEPFKVFPQLVWDEIIERVKKPKDKVNLARCHPHLENFFESKIGEWMFASIAKILFKSWSEEADELYESGEDSTDNLELFLKCRQLSRSILKCTNAFVDKYYHKTCQHPSFFPDKDAKTKEDLRNCLETFESSVKLPKSWNPIPSRQLSLDCNRGRTEEESFNMEDVYTFLQKVGHHIHSLCLSPQIQTQEELVAIPRIFHKIFHCLPNLLEFQLEELFDLEEIPEEVEAAELCLDPINLPNLKHLVMVGDYAYLLLRGIDFSVCFSTLVHFNFCFSLWKDEYNKRAQFPVLTSIFFNHVPIPDAKESLFGLFHHLKSPQIEHIFLGLQDGEEFISREEYDEVVSFIKEVGVLALKQQFSVGYLCKGRVGSSYRRGGNVNDEIDFGVTRNLRS